MSVKAPPTESFEAVLRGPHWAVINKPSGVHSDTWAEHVAGASWGAVHRLDQLTTGALMIAELEWVLPLRRHFQDSEKIKKIYLAGLSQRIPIPESWREELGYIESRYRSSKRVHYVTKPSNASRHHSSQAARHKWRMASKLAPTLAQEFKGLPVEVWLQSGRRHQIRAFFAHLGAPLVGDPVYGDAVPSQPLELHAWKLELSLPELHPELEFQIEIEQRIHQD
jgi:23S rRNA-/tRNA-specific pseudouridylate synthase